jgi:hypothetical protein
VTAFSTEGRSIRKEKYGAHDLLSVYNPSDKSTLYISTPGSYLLASYTRKIIISALDAHLKSSDTTEQNMVEVKYTQPEDGLITLYLNYAMLPRFLGCYSNGPNEYVNKLAEALKTSALTVNLDDKRLYASGHTVINDSVESYLKTLSVSGKAPTEFLELTPQRTAFCVGLGFTSFSLFLDNFRKNLRQDVTEYETYSQTIKEIENYLKIDLQKNVISWIGEEVALLELQSSGKGLDAETALLLQSNNIEKAKNDLAYIEKMIRKRTPVKFKTVEHRGHTISYLSMKGLFKVLLGKFFARYDKPYYTVINNFVVFSNHPQTLKSIIDDYLDKNTLLRSEDFRDFRKDFEDESSVFVYLNTPVLFNSLKKLTDTKTRSSMEGNKEFIICFRQIGFQMIPEAGGFSTAFSEQFVSPIEVPRVTTDTTTGIDSSHLHIETVIANTEVIETETDPMALPYIYVQNLNASDFSGYYADSTLQFEVELKNGFKDGTYTEYHPNGEVKMKGHFRRDKRDGAWRLFDEQGKLILRRIYEEGDVTKEKTRD